MRHTAQLLCPVLKVGDVGLTPLVGDGVVPAPLGGDPPEVAAGVLSLGIVAHGCLVYVERRGPEVERRCVVHENGLLSSVNWDVMQVLG
jgi:hypothetical protein